MLRRCSVSVWPQSTNERKKNIRSSGSKPQTLPPAFYNKPLKFPLKKWTLNNPRDVKLKKPKPRPNPAPLPSSRHSRSNADFVLAFNTEIMGRSQDLWPGTVSTFWILRRNSPTSLQSCHISLSNHFLFVSVLSLIAAERQCDQVEMYYLQYLTPGTWSSISTCRRTVYHCWTN